MKTSLLASHVIHYREHTIIVRAWGDTFNKVLGWTWELSGKTFGQSLEYFRDDGEAIKRAIEVVDLMK